MLNEDDKRFFKLFEESTFEGSQAAARKMEEIAKRQNKNNQKCLLYHSLLFLARSSDSEKLSWPNSPLLVLLQFIDPNKLSGYDDAPSQEGETRATPLHMLADLADPFDYSTHENQITLAKQLIEHGASVNAETRQTETPLHNACNWIYVTNLDYVELLLEEGANPNAQDHFGMIPLMRTAPYAPGTAKFLLNWPTVDVNITNRSGASFLALVRSAIADFPDKIAFPDSGDLCRVQLKFLLRQWREIEEMLVKRGAHDTGITAIE
jgi:hypothetical protein